jgi:hypothetical protein
MSWLQQSKRKAQGSWVSAMPVQAAHVGYARRAAQCPLVGLVGACCQGCAEGKGCSGKEEIEHAHAQHVGFIALVAYWDDAKKLNEEIQKLDAAMAGIPQLQGQWGPFYASWQKWFADDPSGWLGTLEGKDYDDFKGFQLGYNNFLAKVTEIGFITSAAPVDTRHPVEKATDSATKGAEDAIGGVVGTLTTVLTWTAIAGAVGLVLYVGAPILVARLSK